VIATPRTVLRPLSERDAAALFSYRSLPEVYRFQTWVPRDLDDALAFILRYSTDPPTEEGDWRQLGIHLRTDDALVGDCGFRLFDRGQAEIGYTIAPSHQRVGLGTEVVQALVSHLFEARHVQCLIARTDPANVGSITILERVGFRRATSTPVALRTSGESEGDYVYSMQREDRATPGRRGPSFAQR